MNWLLKSSHIPRLFVLSGVLLVFFLLWIISQCYQNAEDMNNSRVCPLKMVINMQRVSTGLNADVQSILTDNTVIEKNYRLEEIDSNIKGMEAILQMTEQIPESEQGSLLYQELNSLCLENISMSKTISSLAMQGNTAQAQEIMMQLNKNTEKILVVLDKLVLTIEILASDKVNTNKQLTLGSQISSLMGLIILFVSRALAGKNDYLKDIITYLKSPAKPETESPNKNPQNEAKKEENDSA